MGEKRKKFEKTVDTLLAENLELMLNVHLGKTEDGRNEDYHDSENICMNLIGSVIPEVYGLPFFVALKPCCTLEIGHLTYVLEKHNEELSDYPKTNDMLIKIRDGHLKLVNRLKNTNYNSAQACEKFIEWESDIIQKRIRPLEEAGHFMVAGEIAERELLKELASKLYIKQMKKSVELKRYDVALPMARSASLIAKELGKLDEARKLDGLAEEYSIKLQAEMKKSD